MLAHSLLGLLCATTPSHLSVKKLPPVHHKRIVGGTLDTGHPAVIELYYVQAYSPTACNGNSSCLQGCSNVQGQSCTSGAGCACFYGGVCSSSLIGPHTLVTAGHCTDLTAGGELSPYGPALTVCSNPTDVNDILDGTPSGDCNTAVLALFNNTCTINDNGSCEQGLLSSQDFIIVDQVVNPGYNANVVPPDNDNDIGLAHLSATTLENGGAEPTPLIFNRASEGASCSDLGSLTFVGYGLTSGNGDTTGVKMSVAHDTGILDDYHNYEGDPGAVYQNPVCNPIGSGEPTCSGDSGGPSLSASGVIMAVASLGDQTCQYFGQDTRVDAHASWIDRQMTQCWSDPVNGGGSAPSCSGFSCSGPPSTTSSGTGATTGSATGSGSGTGGSGGSGDQCAVCSQNQACASQTDQCAAETPNAATGFCAPACNSQSDCASNTECVALFGAGQGNYCYPASGTCVGYVAPGTGGTTGTTGQAAGTTTGGAAGTTGGTIGGSTGGTGSGSSIGGSASTGSSGGEPPKGGGCSCGTPADGVSLWVLGGALAALRRRKGLQQR